MGQGCSRYLVRIKALNSPGPQRGGYTLRQKSWKWNNSGFARGVMPEGRHAPFTPRSFEAALDFLDDVLDRGRTARVGLKIIRRGYQPGWCRGFHVALLRLKR